jgi:predicted MFS family arabinose efflux permease
LRSLAGAPRPPRLSSLRPDSTLGAYGAHNVSLDLLQSFLGGLFVALVANFAAVYARHLDASAFLLSVLLAAPYTGALISPIVVARLPPTLGPREIAVQIALGRLLILVVPLTQSPAVFIALMVGMYLLVTLPSPYVVDVMTRLYPTAVRGRYIGYSRIALTAGLTIGAPVGGFVMDHYGPAVLFPLGAVVGVLGAFAYSRLRPGLASQLPTRSSIRATFHLLAEDRPYAFVVAAITIWGLGALLAGPFYPIMLVNRFGVTYQQVGFLTLVQSACWFISYVYLARRIDRLPAERVMLASMLLSAVLPASYLLAPSPEFLVIGYAANGCAAGGTDLGLLQLIVRSAPPGRAPQYTALVNAVAGARGIIAPFAGSLLGADGMLGTSGVLIAGTALCVAGAAVILRTGRMGTAGRSQESESSARAHASPSA